MLEKTWIVLHKELTDNLRDRRSLSTSLFISLFTPVLIISLFLVLGRNRSERTEQPLALPVAGAENAPALIQFLTQHDVTLQPAPADPEAEVRTGEADVVMVIPPGYGDDLLAGRPAAVQLVFDDSRSAAAVTVQRARRLLQTYSSQIGSLRLSARGIDPNLTSALAIENVNVATPQSAAANLMYFIPYTLILTLFTSGLYILIDSTAGERERGSLEPLLINSVPRRDFVLGKLGATIVFTLGAVTLTLVVLGLLLNRVPLDKYMGVRLDLNLAALVAVWLITSPAVLFAAGLQMIVASMTRTVREAQTYLQLMAIAPGLPGLFLAFIPVKTELWAMLIPTFSQQLLINQILRGEPVNLLYAFVATAVVVGLGVLFVWVSIRLYGREQIVFGKP